MFLENLINDNLSNYSNMQSVEEYNDNLNNYLKKNEDKVLMVSNTITYVKSLNKKNETIQVNKETETSDLYDYNEYDLEILKKNFINPLFSWSMLEKISDFYQWPFICLGNFIENSLSKEVNSQNIEINLKLFKKNNFSNGIQNNQKNQNKNQYQENNIKILNSIGINTIIDRSPNSNIVNYYVNNNNNSKDIKFIFNDIKFQDLKETYSKNKMQMIPSEEILLNDNNDDFAEKLKPVLVIKDDGKGIPTILFNQILFSFSINEKKEFNFFKFGMTMKLSAIRLCKSVLLISKTETEINIGLISKNLQDKINNDFIITPVVNFSCSKNKITPKSNFYLQTLDFIMEEINFIFPNIENLMDYIKSINTGTHLFLYDFKKIKTFEKLDLFDIEENFLKNFELFFDLENQEIIYSYFDNVFPDRKLIDCSFSNYLKFLFLRQNEEINFFLFGKKIQLINPLYCLFNISKRQPDVLKIKQNLKATDDKKKEDSILIDNEIYRGILFNEKFLSDIRKESIYENFILQYDCISNGILFYSNNRLISRLDQNRLGEVCYFVKKMIKLQKNNFKMIKNHLEEDINEIKNQNRNDKTIEMPINKNEEKFFNYFHQTATIESICGQEKENVKMQFSLFSVSGFMELPLTKYPVLCNKMVIIFYFNFSFKNKILRFF